VLWIFLAVLIGFWVLLMLGLSAAFDAAKKFRDLDK